MPDMHSDNWWIRALEGDLNREEEVAWEAHLRACEMCQAEWEALTELDLFMQHAPLPAPAPGFVEKTVERVVETQRRWRQWRVVVGAVLVVIVLLAEILILGSLYTDAANLITALLGAREMLFPALMRTGVGLLTLAEAVLPFALILTLGGFFILMPNGALATLAFIMVRRRRPTSA
ncbi:MAG: anti-sigma factor family protein [Anaerolineales bacterium]